jgi:hypothetical protein
MRKKSPKNQVKRTNKRNPSNTRPLNRKKWRRKKKMKARKMNPSLKKRKKNRSQTR